MVEKISNFSQISCKSLSHLHLWPFARENEGEFSLSVPHRSPKPSPFESIPGLSSRLPKAEDDTKAPPVVSEWLEKLDRGELSDARRQHVLTLMFRFRAWMQAYLEPRAERLRQQRFPEAGHQDS